MTSENASSEVNGLIFKELIKRGYSLEGNTRIWDLGDSKLWYLKPDQAQGYLDLINTDFYRNLYIDKEEKLIDETMDALLDEIGHEPINLIDLGCGDGTRAIKFIKHFRKKAKVRYCPVDISAYMVNKAVKNIKALEEKDPTNGANEVVDFHWNISDFDNTENVLNLLRHGEYKKNVILFLGGTLGNSELHDLLYQIRLGMKPGDCIMIGNFLKSEDRHKKLKAGGVQHEHAEWLIKVPLQLGLGREDIEVNRRFRETRTEIYFTIKKDHVVEFGGRSVRLQKGDQIIVLVGYLYDKKTFQEFLQLYFDEVNLNVSPDEAYGVAFCKV